MFPFHPAETVPASTALKKHFGNGSAEGAAHVGVLGATSGTRNMSVVTGREGRGTEGRLRHYAIPRGLSAGEPMQLSNAFEGATQSSIHFLSE